MEINLELLSIQNPWWQGDSLEFDPVIEAYNRQFLKTRPKILDDFDLRHNHVYTLLGARGLGKSTIIKILIKELITKKKINPKNIFYYSCHNVDTYEQLNELIKTFLDWRKPKNKKAFIFIDEITLVKNWPKGINFLASAGRLKNITTFLIGSTLSGFLDKKEVNLPAGAISKLITSFNFSDFIKLINPSLSIKLEKKFKTEKLKIANFIKHKNQLDYYLDIYFLTGGFISSLTSFKDKGAVDQKIYSDYLHWLNNDMAKLGRDVSLLRQILEQILLKLGEPIGYKTIARKTKAKTHLTVAEYLNILESMLSIKLVYQSDLNGTLKKGAAKKVYFRDPFLFWLFYSYVHNSLNYWQFSRERLHRPEIFSALVENVIFSHLIKDETLDNWGKRVTYWRDNIRKQEINFLVNSGHDVMPILIRYSQNITDNDENLLKQTGFKKGLIISKDKLELNKKIKTVPLTYFLLFYSDLLKA